MKIHGWNGGCVAVSLREVRTTSDVEAAMSPADFATVDAAESLAAARHFGLL